MSRFCRVYEKGRRASGGKRCCKFSSDKPSFPDSRGNDAATRSLDEFHGLGEGWLNINGADGIGFCLNNALKVVLNIHWSLPLSRYKYNEFTGRRRWSSPALPLPCVEVSLADAQSVRSIRLVPSPMVKAPRHFSLATRIKSCHGDGAGFAISRGVDKQGARTLAQEESRPRLGHEHR